MSSRNAEAGDAAVAQLSSFGNVVSIPADLSTEAECRRLASDVGTREDELHILVNNAGATWGEPLQTFPESAWDKLLNLNLKAPFFLTRAFLPLLEEGATDDDPARVVNVGSIDGLHVPPMHTYSYSSSVAAIIFDSNGPGATALTVIRRGPSSLASTRVRWCSAALLEEYE